MLFCFDRMNCRLLVSLGLVTLVLVMTLAEARPGRNRNGRGRGGRGRGGRHHPPGPSSRGLDQLVSIYIVYLRPYQLIRNIEFLNSGGAIPGESIGMGRVGSPSQQLTSAKTIAAIRALKRSVTIVFTVT